MENIQITLEEIEPGSEPMVESVTEPIEEPVIEPIEEPIVESVVEPIVDPVSEPIVEPIVESIVEPIVEPIVESVVEPIVTDHIPEPVAVDVLKESNVTKDATGKLIIEHVPDVIFIVPYRDRVEQKQFFFEHMPKILEDTSNTIRYKTLVIEQSDKRSFNRGAIKNIGFLLVRQLFPNNYKDITLVFNDVDTLPKEKGLINYQTTTGRIKHFYGYTFALGGIVSITGADFERINGFPNYWGWGFEDNEINKRATKAGYIIDRGQFYPISSPNIIQKLDTPFRQVNKGEFDRYIQQVPEGINTISNIICSLELEDYMNGVFKIAGFKTGYDENISKRSVYDLRNGPKPFMAGYSQRRRASIGMAM